jgi:hypothetical protein
MLLKSISPLRIRAPDTIKETHEHARVSQDTQVRDIGTKHLRRRRWAALAEYSNDEAAEFGTGLRVLVHSLDGVDLTHEIFGLHGRHTETQDGVLLVPEAELAERDPYLHKEKQVRGGGGDGGAAVV